MFKKLFIVLLSLMIACFIISGGYGIWQNSLEVEGSIDIKSQALNLMKDNKIRYPANISYKKVQNEIEYRNLNYIYWTDGDSSYSYFADGDLSNTDLLKNMTINQNNKDTIIHNDSNVRYANKTSSTDGEDNNSKYEYNNQNVTNYIYILDEKESYELFNMAETNEQKDYIHQEGSNINYIRQFNGNN